MIKNNYSIRGVVNLGSMFAGIARYYFIYWIDDFYSAYHIGKN